MLTVLGDEMETELKMVHLIFRHGDRTPDHSFPKDIHQNHSYAPWGLGQLNKAGYQRMYNNGKFFRERYDEFLGPLYKQDEVQARSTGMARTRMTLQLFCAGMFPPVDTDLAWNENLNWQPIDFTSLPLKEDKLLFSIGEDFQLFVQELAECFAPVIKKNEQLFNEFAEITGKPIRQPFDVSNLYSTLRSQVESGLELPKWAEPYFPDQLFELSCEAFATMVCNEDLKRKMGGNLLESMIADWEAKISGKSSKKISIYSGHDTTLVGALGACNVWNPAHFPEYGMTAIFELRQNMQNGEYGIQIYQRKDPENEPQLLTIPGCNSFCSLSELKTALSNNLPTASD